VRLPSQDRPGLDIEADRPPAPSPPEVVESVGYPALPGIDAFQILLTRSGTDRAVLYGVLAKFVAGLFGLATLLLIASRFPVEMQGYYYTFTNLIALQVFAEMGLGVVVTQFASHYWARLSLDDRGRIQGEPEALSRLVSLGRLSMRWYAVAGVAAATLIGLFGHAFFSHAPASGIRWQAPWIALCALAGLRLSLIPAWSLLEGCNQVASVYLFRFLSTLVAGLVSSLAILLGLGLWAPAVALGAEVGVALSFLGWRHRPFVLTFLHPAGGPGLDWWADILPLQYRIALTWMAGYFATSVFTPILFYYHGPALAGQWGMTWSMFAMVTSVSLTWVLARAPQFGMLVARREFAALDRQFFRQTRTSLAVACLGTSLIWASIRLLHELGSTLASRVLPPLPSALLAIAVVLVNVPYAQSIYLRAHKREPFLVASLVQSFLLASMALLVGRKWGGLGIACGYLAVMAVVAVPWAVTIWFRSRAEWHAPASGSVTSDGVSVRTSP